MANGAMSNKLVVLSKVERMILDLAPAIERIPKHQRFRYAKRLEDGLWDLVRLVIQAAASNQASKVYRVDEQVRYIHALIRHGHRLLRKDSVTRARRRFKRLRRLYHLGAISIDKVTQHVSSWVAHARHADSYGVRLSTLKTIVLSRCKARTVPAEKE